MISKWARGLKAFMKQAGGINESALTDMRS
jgi:hypothetical protein